MTGSKVDISELSLFLEEKNIVPFVELTEGHVS